ncbi:MAG: hemerythrin family protein [Spirochaetes bacterium]|jgi:hemerythrin|nr:hemerythrin family protein [Spirochaetota bacterium]
MPFLTWNDKYTVGVGEIDEQHRHLFTLTNDFHDALTIGTAKKNLGDALDALVDYARRHFMDEEKLMADSQYPELAHHRIEHDRLTREALDFRARFVEGKPVSTLEFAKFLSDWLVKHIIVMDKKIGIHMNTRGAR